MEQATRKKINDAITILQKVLVDDAQDNVKIFYVNGKEKKTTCDTLKGIDLKHCGGILSATESQKYEVWQKNTEKKSESQPDELLILDSDEITIQKGDRFRVILK